MRSLPYFLTQRKLEDMLLLDVKVIYINIKEKSISVSIFPHESKIAFLALNNSGSLLATASDKGTLIRIFNTLTGDFLNELRRGKDKAEIYSICFNYTSNLLACCSERKTVHIFSLIETEKNINEGVDKKFFFLKIDLKIC